MFRIVADFQGIAYILVESETRVMYWMSYGYYNKGTLTMLCNADGTPLLYKGDIDALD